MPTILPADANELISSRMQPEYAGKISLLFHEINLVSPSARHYAGN